VPADKEKHLGSFLAVKQHVLELTSVEIDESGKDVARLCFVSYYPDLYFNPDALEITPLANTGGFSNTAVGVSALSTNTGGFDNTAVGWGALAANDGVSNTATGNQALNSNTTGASNTANGDAALFRNTTGSQNTAIGDGAGLNATTGSGNVYLGGVAGESNHTYVSNVNSTTVSGGGTDTVTVDLATGLLGHLTSSRRYKEDIKPVDKASEALFALKPVIYRYKKEIDRTQSPAFGLIAEEVAEVNPHLIARNSQGQPESVHYDMVNAMLLNEFLKEHKAFVEAQHKVEKLETTVTTLVATVKEQAAQIQKVSAQLELSKAAPQTVLNNR
jgi:hypothetical protein